MEKYKELADFSSKYPNIVIALGMFDGLHIGHQEIIRTAVAKAQEINGAALVFSFSNHPRSIIAPNAVPHRIASDSIRFCVLKNLSVNALVEIPFTADFAETGAADFIGLLQRYFSPKYVVVGENYTFGRGGHGTPNLLQDSAAACGFQVIVCQPVMRDGAPVSSTRIRALIANGELSKVNEYLGYPFTINGTVIHGQERGRRLGFPTANLALREEFEHLPNGVYAVTVLYQGHLYRAAANIGNNPTFDGCDRRLEVHIMEFSGDLYGEELMISFYKKIRNEQRFSSIDDLIRQISVDKETAVYVLAKTFHLQENVSMVI